MPQLLPHHFGGCCHFNFIGWSYISAIPCHPLVPNDLMRSLHLYILPKIQRLSNPIIMQLQFEKLCLTVSYLSWHLSKSFCSLHNLNSCLGIILIFRFLITEKAYEELGHGGKNHNRHVTCVVSFYYHPYTKHNFSIF